MTTQNQPCEQLILASISPFKSFEDQKQAWIDMFGEAYLKDMVDTLKENTNKKTVIYGDQEEEDGNIIVPDTGHELTDNYLNTIKNLL